LLEGKSDDDDDDDDGKILGTKVGTLGLIVG